jgi:hypothetical protein
MKKEPPKTLKETVERLKSDKDFYNRMIKSFGSKTNLDNAIKKWKNNK